jgi:drug/metabolite transporter (DMT)-like permease
MLLQGSLSSIVFMNKSLASNSVGFFQVSKLCCIPVTLALEQVLGLRHQVLDLEMIISLVLVIVGMVFVSVHDVSIQPIGLFWAVCSVLSTSLAQIYFGRMQKLAELDTPQLLFYTSPFLTVGAFASVPLFESTQDLFNTVLTKHLTVDILSSCGVSFVLNLSNYYVLSWTTPLTYMMIGYLKTILIFAFGILFFDSLPSERVMCGMALTVVGMILYGNAKYRQQHFKKVAGFDDVADKDSGSGLQLPESVAAGQECDRV